MAAKKAKKAPVKKAPAKKKATAIKEKYTKTAIVSEIADNTELSKKQVNEVFEELAVLIERHIKKGGAGEFTMPGMFKVKTVRRPARKARKGVPNPFRPGETMDVAAKPASTKVRILPLKKMKEMV